MYESTSEAILQLNSMQRQTLWKAAKKRRGSPMQYAVPATKDRLFPSELTLSCCAAVTLLQCPWRSPEEASLYDVGSRGSLSAKDEAPLLLVDAKRPTPRRASGDDGKTDLLMPPSALTLSAANRCCWSRLDDTAAISGESERRGGEAAAASPPASPSVAICFFSLPLPFLWFRRFSSQVR